MKRILESSRVSGWSRHTRRTVTAAFVASAAALAGLAACSDSTDNTAPLVATTIVASAGTNQQTGVAGQALATPLSVHVADQNGAAIAGAVVTWTPNSTSGTVAATTSTTDANGDATTAWTLGSLSGIDSLTATLGTGASVVFTATSTAGTFTTLTIVSGNMQQLASGGTTAPLTVKATDQFGNPVAGVAVAWVVTGGGTLSATSSTTDATGTTSVTLTTGAAAGSYSVTATSGTATPVTFTATGT